MPLVVLLAMLVSTWPGTAFQARPDFSGQWATASGAPAAPAAGGGQTGASGRAGAQPGAGARGGGRGGARAGDMGSGWGPAFTITQSASEIAVERAFFARGDMQPPLRFSYRLDGSETTNNVMMGYGTQSQRSRCAWQGDMLVITTTHAFTSPETGAPMTSEVVQRLTLESPSSLVVETTRAGVLGGPPSTTRTVYRKGGAQ